MSISTAIYRYCKYQERCHQEVRDKLYELGCNATEVEKHIAELIESNVLNEERYARAIARGKFRMKHWGRIKITQQLKAKRISDYCIKKALTEIDPAEYFTTLYKLAEKKLIELSGEKKEHVARFKLTRYLMQKGYESSIISDVIAEIKAGKSVE
jgi:regulatory protein